jgi:hypothetical protein
VLGFLFLGLKASPVAWTSLSGSEFNSTCLQRMLRNLKLFFETHWRQSLPGPKEVFELKNASVVMGKIFLGIPHGGPETLQAAVLLEPDPEQGSRKEHTVPTQDHCGFTKDHTEGKVAVLRIHDILVWIRIRIGIRGSMPLTNGS